MSILSDRLNKLLKENNITQISFAERLDVSPSLVSKWCSSNPEFRREPTTVNLIKIADYFNVSLDYLLGRIDVDINSMNHADISDYILEKYGILIDDKSYSLEEIKAMVRVFNSMEVLGDFLK